MPHERDTPCPTPENNLKNQHRKPHTGCTMDGHDQDPEPCLGNSTTADTIHPTEKDRRKNHREDVLNEFSLSRLRIIQQNAIQYSSTDFEPTSLTEYTVKSYSSKEGRAQFSDDILDECFPSRFRIIEQNPLQNSSTDFGPTGLAEYTVKSYKVHFTVTTGLAL